MIWNRRRFLTASAQGAAALATTAAVAIPVATDPRQNIKRLIRELSDAMHALGEGPMRAIVDSDSRIPGIFSPVDGKPMVGRQAIGGVPLSMARWTDEEDE